MENRPTFGRKISEIMSDLNIDVSSLPLELRAKLAELDLELSEGKACLCCPATGLEKRDILVPEKGFKDWKAGFQSSLL